MLKLTLKRLNAFFYFKENKQVQSLLRNAGRPIYHVHIRKTAGTTINFAFLRNIEPHNIELFYERLAKKTNHRLVQKEKVVVGWDKHLINSGQYSYGFSHIPLHQLNLPKHVFTFTCLRNPVNRVISHYNMLMYYKKNNINHSCMKTEGKWLGNGFEDFIKNIPKKHLLNQLYMFSQSYDVLDAVNKINNLDLVLFTEELESGLLELQKTTGWKLSISNEKRYGNKEIISDLEIEMLKAKLQDEIKMIDIVKKQTHNQIGEIKKKQ